MDFMVGMGYSLSDLKSIPPLEFFKLYDIAKSRYSRDLANNLYLAAIAANYSPEDINKELNRLRNES